jgi:D-arabinose 1-dehydrogenase-like Zn-dependent alcohol dehydrogenase
MAAADLHDELAPRVEGLGYRLPTRDGESVAVALIDVGLGGLAHESIRRWASSGAHVVAFGDVDDLSADGLRALGADVVVTTTELLEDPAAHLPVIA